MPWYLWLLPPAAYLLGSLSFAWFAGRLKGIDLREHGSRNLGATNAGRVLGRRWFFLVFAADLGKGLLAVLAAAWLPLALAGAGRSVALELATAAAVVLGHSFTCFHGFKGGKAVATSLGVLIAILPLVAAASFAVWLLAWTAGWLVFRAARSDAVGPASVLAALAAPAIHVALAEHPWRMPELASSIFVILLSTLVVVRHRRNIARMLGRAAPPPPAA